VNSGGAARVDIGRLAATLACAIAGTACQTQAPADGSALVLQNAVVEAGCGQCQFGLGDGGCDLAIRHATKIYWVDGTGIDDHGDAHASNGFCNARARAQASGSVVGERFHATAFRVLSRAPTETDPAEGNPRCTGQSDDSLDAPCECTGSI